MEQLARLGGGLYTFCAIAIGLRLVRLWWRTRGLPELLMGSGILLLAGLGYPLSSLAREAVTLAPSTRVALGAVAALLGATGLSANTAFTWLLFRRDVAWARGLLVAVVGLAAALLVAQALRGGWERGAIFWSGLPLGITASYGWAALECGRYHRLMRRRLALGLADPVVANRFGLYAVATAMAVGVNLVGWVFWSAGVEMLTHPVGGAVLFVFGSSSSVLMLLAFLPPRAYLARVRSRAGISIATTM